MFTVKAFNHHSASPFAIYEAEEVRPSANNSEGTVDEIEIIRPYPQSRVVIWLGSPCDLSSGLAEKPYCSRVTVENSAGRRVEDFQPGMADE